MSAHPDTGSPAETIDGVLRPGRGSVRVDGLRLSYEVRGTGPLLVAHSGGPGAGSGYLRMPEVERFATVVYIDPVGTGESDRLPGGDYSMVAYARLAALFIAALPGGTAHFIGHSHGGMVALQLALDHPHVLRGAIVYDGRATGSGLVEAATERMDSFVRRYPGDPEAADARAAWDDAVAQEEPDTQPVDAATRDRVGRRMVPAYLADFRAQPVLLERLRSGRVTFVDPDRRPGRAWDVRSRLPEITVPLAVFVGKHDFICDPRAASTIWQDVPDARLETFSRSGHYAHLEEPAAFAAAVRRHMGV
jgi:pimeloyl-ACP methyl ester carboxylesterase